VGKAGVSGGAKLNAGNHDLEGLSGDKKKTMTLTQKVRERNLRARLEGLPVPAW